MSPNVDLLNRTLAHIEEHPEQWNQEYWAVRGVDGCGTAYCFAGHAAVLSGVPLWWHDDWEDGYSSEDDDCDDWRPVRQVADNISVAPQSEFYNCSIKYAATHLLGLSSAAAARLFHGDNTLDDLRRIVAELTADAPEVSA